jgi:perosamine synthetase
MSDSNFEFQQDLKNRKRITWLVSLLVGGNDNNERDLLIELLKDNGIQARPFFYLLSDMDIYKKYSRAVNSSAKKISSCGISLPAYESLKSLEQIEIIIKKIVKQ